MTKQTNLGGGVGSGSYRISKSGVKVFEDWRDNFIVDATNPLLNWKASLEREKFKGEIVAGLSRLGSENSEDALTWNYFRTFQRKGWLLREIAQRIPSLQGAKTEEHSALFWGHDPEKNGALVDESLQAMLDRIEPWGKDGQKQQTEPDLIVLCSSAIIAVECKLGTPGASVDAWNRRSPDIPEDYRGFVEAAGLPCCFVDGWDWKRDGQRFYQLMRNWILANALAAQRGAKPYLIAVVNEKNRNANGRAHCEEFEAFKQMLPKTRRAAAVYLTWQVLYDDVLTYTEGQEAVSDDYTSLKKWLERHPALGLGA